MSPFPTRPLISWTAFLVGVAAVSHAGGRANGPALEALLSQAGAYAERFEGEVRRISAQETYTQRLFAHRNLRPLQARTLKSDVALVAIGGDLRWTMFRDVFEVDGKPVRERDGRLAAAVAAAADGETESAQEIVDASARYNLGRLSRNFNVPTLVLAFLHPQNQSRFQFKLKGKDKVEGRPAFVLSYEEKSSPTFIRGSDGEDLFASGRVWIEDATGHVLRSEMAVKIGFGGGTYRVDTTVRFGGWREDRVFVPREMREMTTYTPPAADRTPHLREATSPLGGGTGSPVTETIEENDENLQTVATYSEYRDLADAR